MYAGDWENEAIFNREETEAILIDENICKKYTIPTKTLGSSLFDPSVLSGMGMAIARTKSAYGTYVVWVDEACDNVYIMKNGDGIKTMSYTDLGITSGYIRGANISAGGKYIAVAGTRSATGNRGWVVLVGS